MVWELTADTPKERDEWVEMLSALVLGKSRERLNARMSGSLIKQGHIIRNWKSRYRFAMVSPLLVIMMSIFCIKLCDHMLTRTRNENTYM